MKAGDTAPDFRAKDHTGSERTLSEFAGQRLVLWFYPKADTPGCSREGCGFRDLHERFQEKGAYSAERPDYPARNTYVIGPEGTLEQVLDGVNPKTHPRSLLDSLG